MAVEHFLYMMDLIRRGFEAGAGWKCEKCGTTADSFVTVYSVGPFIRRVPSPTIGPLHFEVEDREKVIACDHNWQPRLSNE